MNMQKLTEDDFAGLKAEFGYLLMIEGHGLEALFKIIKNEDVYYFAAQQDQLSLLEINESLYQSTVKNMLSMHT